MLRIGVVMYQTSLTKGQELVAERMVREFKAQGYDAFLITSPFHDGEAVISDEELSMHAGFMYLFDEKLDIPVIRVSSVPTSWPPRRASLADFIDTLTKIVDNFKINVLITHSTLWNGPEEILKFVEWRRNLSRDGVPKLTPIFCHMSHFQEASPDRYEINERAFREAWNQTSLSMIVREADLVLVVSPYEKELMKAHGASEDKCFTFPGGIEEMVGLVGDPEALRARLSIAKEAKIVASLGTVEERKNTLNVVSVAKQLSERRDIHFVIAGTEQGEYGKKVREAAANMANISVMGSISDVDKSALIGASSINLIMSRSEALGITQLEFLSNRVPVVTSGAGGQHWVVKNWRNGIIIEGPDDIAGAASAITRLVDDDSLRKKLGENAAESSRRFSMTRLTHSLAKRLESLVARRSDEERLRRGMTDDEKPLEAMVNGRMRVIVTNRRLIVKDDHGGGKTVSARFEDIFRITRHVRYPWQVLTTSLAATVLLFVLTLTLGPMLPPHSVMVDLGLMIAPFIPLFFGVPLFFTRARNGYSVQASSGSIFIPKQFLRLLKLVDRLVSTELFDETELAESKTPEEKSAEDLVAPSIKKKQQLPPAPTRTGSRTGS